MKIAMIGHKQMPSRAGGIEIVVEELSVRMAAAGHEVHVYNRRDKNDDPKMRDYKGVRLHHIPTFNRSALNAIVYSALASFAALFGRYDVIHYHAQGPSAMTWLPKLFGIPLVATNHGLDWQRSKWGGFATKYLKHGEKNSARYPQELIVLSEAIKTYFMDTYARETNLVPNGVTIRSAIEPSIIRKSWGLEKERYCLFLARLVPEKGLHYLLDAFRNVDTDMKLVVAGSLSPTDYVEEIKALAAKDPRVILTDFVTGDTWQELMSNCALYVLPSDVEGMPISLLQALSFGRRCLASDISENVGLCTDHATYFRHGDIDDLTQKLRLCLKQDASFDPAAQIQWVKSNYDWDAVTAQTLALYEKARKEKRGFFKAHREARKHG